MSNRQRLEAFSAALKDNEQVREVAWKEQRRLQQQFDNAARLVIKEEKMLGAAPWEYVSINGSETSFYLQCTETWEHFKEIRDLLKPDYHSCIGLVTKDAADFTENDLLAQMRYYERNPDGQYEINVVHLYFNDGQMDLRFNSDADGIKFVREWGIPVDFSRLENDLIDAEHRVATLRALLDEAKENINESEESDDNGR